MVIRRVPVGLEARARASHGRNAGPVGALDALCARKPDAQVALLQGSFDWIHNGHLELFEAIARTSVDVVVVMPTVTNDDKPFLAADARARLALVEAAVAAHPALKDRVVVSDAAIARGAEAPHVLIEQLLTSYPDARFSYVLGADAFNASARWPTFGVVEDHMALMVVPRAGVALENQRRADTLVDVTPTAISSSEVRRALAEGDLSALRGRVPPTTMAALEQALATQRAARARAAKLLDG